MACKCADASVQFASMHFGMAVCRHEIATEEINLPPEAGVEEGRSVKKADAEAADQVVHPWTRFLIILLVILVMADVVSALESSMIFAAFKSIIEETGDPAGAGWLVSSFFIIAGPASLVASRLGDLYGRKQTLIGVLLGVLAGSLISAFSGNLTGIVIGRGLQGLSGAIMPLCVGIYRTNAPRDKLGVGLGVLLSAHAIGTLVGLLVGGVIVDHADWRFVFRASAGAAILALTCVAIWAPNTGDRSKEPLDWLGYGLVPPMAAMLYVVSTIGKGDMSGAEMAAITILSLMALAIWARHELRHASPLVDLQVLRQRSIAISNLIGFIVSIGPSQIGLYFALTLQQPSWTGIGFGLSASVAGLIKAPTSLVSALIGPWTGHAVDRLGPKIVLIVGAVIQLLGWLIVLVGHVSLYTFVPALFLCSGGAMILNVGLTSVVTLGAVREKTSEAVGMLIVSKSIGSAIGSQVMGVLLGLSVVIGTDGKTSFPSPAAHIAVIAMLIVTSALALVLAFQFRRRLAAGAAPVGLAEAGAVAHHI